MPTLPGTILPGRPTALGRSSFIVATHFLLFRLPQSAIRTPPSAPSTARANARRLVMKVAPSVFHTSCITHETSPTASLARPSGGLAAESTTCCRGHRGARSFVGQPALSSVCGPRQVTFECAGTLASMAPSSGAILGPPLRHGRCRPWTPLWGVFWRGLRLARGLLWAWWPRGFRRDGCAGCKWKAICSGGFLGLGCSTSNRPKRSVFAGFGGWHLFVPALFVPNQ